MHAQFVRVRTDIRPLQVDYVNPLGQGMVSRGNKTERLFMEFVDFVSERSTVYQTPANIPGASVCPAHRLASLGLDFIAQGRQLFNKPSFNTVAALQGRTRPEARCRRTPRFRTPYSMQPTSGLNVL